MNRAKVGRISSINSKVLSHEHQDEVPQNLYPEGIHIGDSRNVDISHCRIGAGDSDCISVGPGSCNVMIANVHSVPGHGIGVGGLGR